MIETKATAATEDALPGPAVRDVMLSIVIVSWNTRDLLADCLASVFAQLLPWALEVIVADNHSADGSVKMLRECFPSVRLIENRENVGFARANNQAIRQSAGRYVLLLNPDTTVEAGALEQMVDYMEREPGAGAAGSLILNPDGTLQTSCYPGPTLTRELWRLLHLDKVRPYGSYEMSRWSREKPRQVDAVLGACLLIRSVALEQVGLLDETYFIYSEEIDLCYRLRRAGWRVFWLPQARIVHFGGQSTRQVAQPMFLHLYRSKILYFRKHYGRSAARAYKAILLVAGVARLLVAPLAYLQANPGRRQRLALARSYGRLLQELPGM